MFGMIWEGVKAVFSGPNKTSGTDRVMEVARGVGTWIDEREFQPEEKAKFDANLLPVFQSFMDSTVNENTQRSITRREIALWVMRNWIAMLWLCIVTRYVEYIIAPIVDGEKIMVTHLSDFVFEVATYSSLTYLVLGIGAFFYGAHIVRTAQSGRQPASK